MGERWKRRPEGSNWGEHGASDQIGQMNVLTSEIRLRALREVQEGEVFTLSMPLDYPGKSILSPNRHPPAIQVGRRSDGSANYQFAFSCLCAAHVDVVNDDAITLHTQYSTQWDALAHYGCEFDTQGDGITRQVYYNGFRGGIDILGPADGGPKARSLGIENFAVAGVQGRGVLVDTYRVYGMARHLVGYDDLMRILDAQKAEVRPGDFLCLYTGFADLVMSMGGEPDGRVLRTACSALRGADERLLRWITDSKIVAICADNLAVEAPDTVPAEGRYAKLPLHEHCLFKIGVHLGELWLFKDLAAWLRARGRSAFLLTAPPLRMPGSVGSPVTPIATV